MRRDRLISAVVAGVWLLAVFAFDQTNEGAARPGNWVGLVGAALFALALIWFGDELGGYSGGTMTGRTIHETPGCFVKFMGWVFLFGFIGWWLYSFSLR